MSKYIRKFFIEVGPLIIGLASFTWVLTMSLSVWPQIVESQDTFTQIGFIVVSLAVAMSLLFFWMSKIPPAVKTKESKR